MQRALNMLHRDKWLAIPGDEQLRAAKRAAEQFANPSNAIVALRLRHYTLHAERLALTR